MTFRLVAPRELHTFTLSEVRIRCDVEVEVWSFRHRQARRIIVRCHLYSQSPKIEPLIGVKKKCALTPTVTGTPVPPLANRVESLTTARNCDLAGNLSSKERLLLDVFNASIRRVSGTTFPTGMTSS